MNEDRLLDVLQHEAFSYFEHETNRANGMVLDKTTNERWPASIAAIGLGLSGWPVAVERGFVSRDTARGVVAATLRFLLDSEQSPAPDATGYQGFYYHFLDMRTGRRANNSELSTVDTALLLAGVLAAAVYFAGSDAVEVEIRSHAAALYDRVEWRWALNQGTALTHGWTPEAGFLPYRWLGYDEAMILYLLALGAADRAVPPSAYAAWVAGYEWKRIHDLEYLYAGPLFTHQLSHLWIDFRGIRDDPMRVHDSDYFENSRRATLVQQRYAIENPLGFAHYHQHSWGITASDGPGDVTRRIDGVERRFFDYLARGVPFGPDDGTLAPWAVVASLPFAPEVVLPTVEHFDRLRLRGEHRYGFKATFNPTFGDGHGGSWVSPFHFGINQGPILVMIENHRTGLVWELMRRVPAVVTGLRRAGFRGGWLDRA